MVPIVQAVLDQMDNTENDVTMMEQATGQTNTVIELEEKNASDPTPVQGKGLLKEWVDSTEFLTLTAHIFSPSKFTALLCRYRGLYIKYY